MASKAMATEAPSGSREAKGKQGKALYHLVLDELDLDPVLEYRFAPPRRYRFDMAFPEHKIAVEYEGLVSSKSRHTTLTGYSGDCSKYNLATCKGWRVLRYTALNYREVCHDLPILLNQPKPLTKPQPELLEAVEKVTTFKK